MCGIGGFVHDNPGAIASPGPLEAMNVAQAHRGPDDAGVWCEGPAGLAHRRLSVLDPTAAGHQPMFSSGGRLVAVFNGEIYNFREIRADLEKTGHTFHTDCDTEVLVEAWSAWGERALERFNGMFAFAMYDRERHRLTLVRDRAGVKPLFYTLRNGTLAFASELGALVNAGFVNGALNASALAAFFTYLYIPAPDTIYRDVYKLRPGEMLTFESGAIHSERYWRFGIRPDASWTRAAAAERLLELLRDSVRLRQISDVPLGAFLSGGIDSSAITSLLSEISETPAKTFTIGFNDSEADELAYARLVARHCGTDHTEAILDPDMVALLPRMARHFGEPFADSSALPTWLVSQVARQRVTVALSGDGGDELFAGYTWMRRNRDVARYRAAPAALRRAAGAFLRLAPSSPRVERLRRFNTDSFLTPVESFRRRLTCFSSAMRSELFRPEVREAAFRAATDRYLEHAEAAHALDDDDIMLYLDTVMYLPDDILAKVDRMSMAHGLEARTPLLDYRIVEFAASLPFDLKLSDGISKRILKQAVRGLLPPEILRERKRGFALPIQRWFRGTLGTHFREKVLNGKARSASFLNLGVAQRLFELHTAGRMDYGHQLWSLLIFETWLSEVDNRVDVYLE